MFGNEDVKQLVEFARSALDEENHHIDKCFKERRWKIRENGPGICDNLNERYYQFIIWRGLMASPFPWRPRTERKDYDLALYDDETGKLEGVARAAGDQAGSQRQVRTCFGSWSDAYSHQSAYRRRAGELPLAC
jgi:hypothetical protein